MKKHKKTVKWCVKQIRKQAKLAHEAAVERQSGVIRCTAFSGEPTPNELAGRGFMLTSIANDILRKAGVEDD